jgi:hypothetical protein
LRLDFFASARKLVRTARKNGNVPVLSSKPGGKRKAYAAGTAADESVRRF